MDWTIVVSVLVALLLWPVVLASLAALMFLTAAAALRGRIRGLMDRKFGQCKRMCNPGELATAAGPATPKSCQ